MTRFLQTVALVCLVALTACSASTRHIAVTADQTVFEVMDNIHSGEQQALCGKPSCATVCTMTTEPPTCTVPPTLPGWTAVKSKAFNRKLLPASEAGRQYNTLLAGWRPGTATPPSVSAMIASLGESLTAVVTDFPDGTTKDAILKNIGVAQAIVLNAFRLVLAVKEGA